MYVPSPVQEKGEKKDWREACGDCQKFLNENSYLMMYIKQTPAPAPISKWCLTPGMK
jgi:hypothetical protein